MSSPRSRLDDLTREQRQDLLKRILERRAAGDASPERDREAVPAVARAGLDQIPESSYRFEKFPRYFQLHLHQAMAERANIQNPFFRMHEAVPRATTVIDGREVVNFSSYNYLALNGDPRVVRAAQDAAERWGTSASASRIASGERPPHRDLEHALASLHGVEDAVAMVSGHATNVTVIGCLTGPKDIILHDRLIHNSVLEGAQLSGAARHSFPHNDWRALDEFLAENRCRYEKALIVVEGVYSMDGDVCPLEHLVEVKERHKALLMVDEAHALGVLGASGQGTGDHFGVPGKRVDIWMGTLSKALAGCGGYIAGCTALVELLKFTAPGFVYSVGIPPPIAAAAREAIRVMLAEPWRSERVRVNGRLFLEEARLRGLDTGLSEGFSVVPVIVGRSVLAVQLSNALLDRGICVQPIIYPAVEEQAARLRFFLCADHTEEQIRTSVAATAEEMTRLRATAE